jgi:outer membrane receptor protein involved in Fe transport
MKARILGAASAVALGCLSVPGPAQDTSTTEAPPVEVISTIPVPGLGIDKNKIPGNIQSVGQKEIQDLKSAGLNSLLEQSVGSITVNNYQGNPFQPDVSYRGFTASPLLGTPQGLSVYLDSVRVNDPQQGYFSSFGKTRRQGVELGFSGRIGRVSWQSNYTYLDATFQSPASLVNSANSSSDANGVYTVQPGDRLPGIPQHMFKINAAYDLTHVWSIGASLFAQSYQYVRGNENNLHQSGGTDADGHPFVNDGTVPGFAVVNLRTRYNFDNGLSVFAELDNLFDRKYYTAGSLNVNPFAPGAGGTVGANGFNYNSAGWQNATFYTPGAPLGIWVGLAYRFGARKADKD